MNTLTLRLRIAGVKCLALVALLSAALVSAQPAERPIAITVEDAGVLVDIVRSRIQKDYPVPENIPAMLHEPLQAPLIVTAYDEARAVQRVGVKETLADSARAAADELVEVFKAQPKGVERRQKDGSVETVQIDPLERLARARLQLDVVVSRSPIGAQGRTLTPRNVIEIVDGVTPGIDGLQFASETGTWYFPPLTVLSHLRHERQDPIWSLFHSLTPIIDTPKSFTAHRIRTASFVEVRAVGGVAPLYRGNVLLMTTDREQGTALLTEVDELHITEAVARAGLWLLRAQQPDGSFLMEYNPGAQAGVTAMDEPLPDGRPRPAPAAAAQKVYGVTDHLRILSALVMLHQFTGDARFNDAAGRAIEYVTQGRRVYMERNFAHLTAAKNEEVTTSAMLLTALCMRSFAQAPEGQRPVASGLMRQLGEFLCLMTSDEEGNEGRLFAQLAGAQKRSGAFLVHGLPYAEALQALDLLQRIAPSERIHATAERLAKLMAKPPKELRLRGDLRTNSRLAEALALHYRTTRVEAYAEAARALVEDIREHQLLGEKAPFPDYQGAFQEGPLFPDSHTTAAATCALTAGYEIALLTRREPDQFAIPVRAAALFLINMQYRPVNSFFVSQAAMIEDLTETKGQPNQRRSVSQQEWVIGGFRRGPENLTITAGGVAEAVRALGSAFTVVVETAGRKEGK